MNKTTIDEKIWKKLTKECYLDWYRQSLTNPETFWAEQAQRFVTWYKPWQKVMQTDFNKAEINWFVGSQLNVSFNCIDRHLATQADKTAILWERDQPSEKVESITYQQLHDCVCQIANVLKSKGVKKGSRVCLYLPMIPEAAYSMLACARIGAVHSVVFGGFSAQSLKDRIEDAEAEIVITADFGTRGGKKIALKNQVDKALENVSCVKHVLVVQHTGDKVAWDESRDHWLHDLTKDQPTDCKPEVMEAEDPLFILYTSGSTGKPKGVLHTQAGYLTYAAMTFRYAFDYQPEDIYWCTADVGWITGHTYLVYGPLALGATTVLFEGVPNYPTPSRCWEIVDKHSVSIFYTAPTAIRALMAHGDAPVQSTSRQSLRVLGTVGEPINPEAWRWYYDVVGEGKRPIVDTWWQTETGGIMIAPLIGCSKQQPGSAGVPFFGVHPKVVNEQGEELKANQEGALIIAQSWPGQMRTVYKDHERFKSTYFSQVPGAYFTGDGAHIDEYGEYWISGRMDDVINISGHRLGTAEVESALVLHPKVAESAVVGIADEIKGQNIVAFVTLNDGEVNSSELKDELLKQVISAIGKFAVPKILIFTPNLPKTRSGKIMRRILRKISENELDELGDTSTLADASVVDDLIQLTQAERKKAVGE